MVTITDAHSDLIHDAQLDYYGKTLATCSSDKTIKLYEISQDSKRLVETLRGHEGPVWQVAWGHPKFGAVLASCSYDGKIIIWREENGVWAQGAVHRLHHASVNSVQWAPSEYGPLLLAASSDGQVSIIGEEDPIVVQTHAVGANAAAWAPPGKVKRFVTGGGDNLAKVWVLNGREAKLEATLEKHTDWVRDVAWSPSVLQKSYIASASQDKTVVIWTQEKGGEWKATTLDKFGDVVWRVSWSLSGNILAVSGGDNKVTLWKENLRGEWESAGDVE